MHSDNLTLQRLARAVRDRIRPALTTPIAAVQVTAWTVGGEPVPAAVAMQPSTQAQYRPFAIGERWGKPWDTTWFRVRGEVPAAAYGKEVELVVDLGWNGSDPGFQAEALAYRPDGSVIKALEPLNAWLPIDGESVDVYLEAAANPGFTGHGGEWHFVPSRLGDPATAGDEPIYRLVSAEVVLRDPVVAGLLADLELVGGLAAEESVDATVRAIAVRALDGALNLLDAGAPFEQVRTPLRKVLDSPATASAHRISATGHAHIDSAWLWPLRETRRKVARTVANVLQLMDTDDDLVFVMSAAQHWEWLREDHPALFERAAARVREGRFVPVGGMWVESDTVMPGGEAMVRQFLQGQRFFREHFGRTSRIAWLPDSFGYSGALPQIVRQAGVEYFLTQKICWNQVNRFPHHTFEWVGIDGTGVFTHFPPVDDYNGVLTPRELTYTAANFREKGAASRSLIPFGHGDGGGGPTREMLARAARSGDVEGLPRVRVETPEAFFDAARAEYPEPPQWFGELYLELHRGTLTSQAAMKRGNRRSEHLLRAAELWSATAAVAGLVPYPYEQLQSLWRTVLMLQFHDILPGSSISWVHAEARELYASVAQRTTAMIAGAQQALAGPGSVDLVFNAAPVPVGGVPAGGAAPDSVDRTVANDRTAVTIAADGTISSLIDLATGTEAITPGGRGALLQLHPDYPTQWDAWDVDKHYRAGVTDLDTVESIEYTATGAVVERRFGDSWVRQTFSVRPGQPGVDIHVEVDWQERQRLLKLAFDVDVHADRARFETQFGHLARSTHENTSWDVARFEVAAHRWVHVGEPAGVALVNDCTYGHEVRRVARPGGGMATSLRATLLRGPRFPDPGTDLGRHEFRFRLLPAATTADAVTAGYELNLPPVVVRGGAPVRPLVRLDGDPNLLIEAVKLAEDRSGDVIVRVYESGGVPGTATLHPSFAAAGFTRTDLLEDPVDGENPADGAILTLRPFQVATVRISRAAA